MGLNEEIIKEIINRILAITRPSRIILFGSAASGQMTGDSDIDLLILEASTTNPRQESVIIGDALRGIGYPFDIIIMASDRFEESKDIIGGIAYPANKYGKILYDATGKN